MGRTYSCHPALAGSSICTMTALRSSWLFANLALLLTCGLLLVDKDPLAKAGKVAKWT